MKKNNTLKYLNLYGNIIDVKGAEFFADYLATNKSLEFCDLGYNRVRDKGLAQIIDAISDNKDCKLKTLGLKFNFIAE